MDDAIHHREAETRLSDQERVDWLRLIRSDNVGPRTFRTLVDHCGSARAALNALPELARRGGAKRSMRIYSREDAERELDAAHALGVKFIAQVEPDYPWRLKMIDDAPPLLAVGGRSEALAKPMIAIVGSRNASAVGLKFAGRIARDLGEAGFVTVSGLARGIDGAVHRASLDTATIAVLASGPGHVYPPEHADLLGSIFTNGAMISEMPVGWEPRAHDFPRRNRLISGLSLGVVVVEAAKRSGSLITARFALEQGREVFAVPGSPLDPRSEGTNNLIKQGAAIITEAADIINVIEPILGHTFDHPAPSPQPKIPQQDTEPDTGLRTRIIALLGPSPVTIDDLIRLSGGEPAMVRTTLLELTLAGRLERHRGGTVSLT